MARKEKEALVQEADSNIAFGLLPVFDYRVFSDAQGLSKHACSYTSCRQVRSPVSLLSHWLGYWLLFFTDLLRGCELRCRSKPATRRPRRAGKKCVRVASCLETPTWFWFRKFRVFRFRGHSKLPKEELQLR